MDDLDAGGYRWRGKVLGGAMRDRRVATAATRFAIFCLFGFAVLNGAQWWRLREPISRGYGDFASFYTAGRIVLSGQPTRLYDRTLQWKVQQQFASTVTIRRGPLPYIRPPFEALLFAPLAALNYPAAYFVWLVVNVAMLLAIPFLLAPIGDREFYTPVALAWLFSLAFFPVAFDLIQGQDAVLLLLILALALRFLVRGAELRSGLVLALGLFKFHLVLPLMAILLLKKKFRVFWGFVFVALVLMGISVGMVHWSGFIEYPRYLISLNQGPGMGMVTKARSMANLRGFLPIFSGNEHLSLGEHFFLGGIVILGIVVGSRFWRGKDPKSVEIAFCSWIAVTLSAAYYSNSYDLTLLLLPLFVLGKTFWRGCEVSGWPRMLFLGSAGLMLCAPFQWWLALPADQYRWVLLVLVALAISICGAEKVWRPAQAAQ